MYLKKSFSTSPLKTKQVRQHAMKHRMYDPQFREFIIYGQRL